MIYFFGLRPLFLGLIFVFFVQYVAASQEKNLAKSDDMIKCMIYLLKYKYDDFNSPVEKSNEAENYKTKAISLASKEYYEERLIEIDTQLMVAHMERLPERTARDAVVFYEAKIKNCRKELNLYRAIQ